MFALLEKDDPRWGLLPNLVVYKMKEGERGPPPSHQEIEDLGKVFKNVDRVYIVPNGQGGMCCCRDLGGHPHGHEGPNEVRQLEALVRKENTLKARKGDELIIISPKPHEDFEDDFCTIRWMKDSEIWKLRLPELAVTLLDAPIQKGRNNRIRNWGTIGWRNSSNTEFPESLGLWKPRRFKDTDDPLLRSVIKESDSVWTKYFGEKCRNAYSCPLRQREFSIPHMFPLGTPPEKLPMVGNKIEAATFAVNILANKNGPTKDNYTFKHCDTKNDPSPVHSPVFNNSAFVVNTATAEVARVATLAYGKRDAGHYMDRKKRHHGFLKLCVAQHNNLPNHRKTDLPTELLATTEEARSFKGKGKVHKGVNIHKTFMCGQLAMPINHFFEIYTERARNPDYLCALVYATCIFHQPDQFYRELEHLLAHKDIIPLDGLCLDDHTDPKRFAVAFYNHMFDKQTNKSFDYTSHNRHAPTHTRKATAEQIWKSVQVLRLFLHNIHSVSTEQMSMDPTYFYCHAVDRLGRQKCSRKPFTDCQSLVEEGLFGVGTFLVNHLLGTLHYCGATPPAIHDMATVGEQTGSYRALQNFALEQHIPEVLAALSTHLKIDIHAAEELVCITGCKDNARKTHVCRLGDRLGVIRNKQAHYRLMSGDCVPVPQIDPSIFVMEGRVSASSYWSKTEEYLPKWNPKNRSKSSSVAKLPTMSVEVPCRKVDGGLLLQLVHPQKIFGHQHKEPPWNCLIHHGKAFLFQRSHVKVTASGCLLDANYAPPHVHLVQANMNEDVVRVLEPGTRSGKYWKWTVKLPAFDGMGDKVVEADPDFPLRDDYPNPGDSIVDPRTNLRYFHDDAKAKCFALLSALFVHAGRTTMHSFGRMFWQAPSPDKDLSVPLGSWQECLPDDDDFRGQKAGGIGGHRVAYKVLGALTADIPYVVSLLHSNGAIVHYLCNDCGRCNSGVMVTPGRHIVPRVVPGREDVIDDCGVVAGIVDHRHQGSAQVLVAWMDGVHPTWEKVAEVKRHSSHHLRQYGMRNKLHLVPGWKHLLDDKKSCDFDGYPRFLTTYVNLREALQNEKRTCQTMQVEDGEEKLPVPKKPRKETKTCRRTRRFQG